MRNEKLFKNNVFLLLNSYFFLTFLREELKVGLNDEVFCHKVCRLQKKSVILQHN